MPLSELLEQKVLFTPKRVPAEPVAVHRAKESISRRWPNAEAVDPETDAEKLAVEMECRRQNKDWQSFFWADAAHTASAFLSKGLWREERFAHLLDFLLFQIGPSTHPAYLRIMFRKYLETFDPKSKLTGRLAGALTDCWKAIGLPIDRLVHHFRVFDIDTAPHQAIAAYMNVQPQPFRALREDGLEAPHGPGLMQLAHRCFVSMLKSRIAGGDIAAVKKMLDWLNPEGEQSPLQGPEAGVAINALLLPWVRYDPNESLKKTIETRLIDAYGDIRVQNVGVWSACSDKARRVILRWLAGTSIKVFFDIVTEAESSHMWSDRKGLWLDLYRQGDIAEAWFALSDYGGMIARRLNREREGVNLPFARNDSMDSQDRKKCLLIMKVYGRWVVEGSHSFPTWVFPPGDLPTLKPYEDRYTCNQIRYFQGTEQPQRIVHLGNWRNKVMMALQQ